MPETEAQGYSSEQNQNFLFSDLILESKYIPPYWRFHIHEIILPTSESLIFLNSSSPMMFSVVPWPDPVLYLVIYLQLQFPNYFKHLTY